MRKFFEKRLKRAVVPCTQHGSWVISHSVLQRVFSCESVPTQTLVVHMARRLNRNLNSFWTRLIILWLILFFNNLLLLSNVIYKCDISLDCKAGLTRKLTGQTDRKSSWYVEFQGHFCSQGAVFMAVIGYFHGSNRIDKCGFLPDPIAIS